MKKKQLSMRDISELSGVSIATVSRIINKNGRYSKETEERVNAIIKEYNYVPNMIAKGLRTRNPQSIGIIVPDITNEFFAKIILEIQNALFESAYSTFICNTDEKEDIEKRHLSILKSQSVAGLIYVSGDMGSKIVPPHDLPTVYIDRKPPFAEKKFNTIVIESDNISGAHMATRELIKKGCRNIAIINARANISTHTARFEGYCKAIEQAGLPVDERLHLRVDNISFYDAHNSVLELIDSGVEFDGIFCATDWLALGALAALESSSINVPDTVKIVGFDDISISALCKTPITTIHQQVDKIGKIAVEQIMKLINDEKITKKHFVIPVELVSRKTT